MGIRICCIQCKNAEKTPCIQAWKIISKSILVKGEVATGFECNVPFLCCLCCNRETQKNYLRSAMLTSFYSGKETQRVMLPSCSCTIQMTLLTLHQCQFGLEGDLLWDCSTCFLPKNLYKSSVLPRLLIKVCPCMCFIFCKSETRLSCMCVYLFYIYISTYNIYTYLYKIHVSLCVFFVSACTYQTVADLKEKMPHCN